MQDIGVTRTSESVAPVTTGSEVPWESDNGRWIDRPVIDHSVIDHSVIDRLRDLVSAPALAAIAAAYLDSLPSQIHAISGFTAQRDMAKLLWTAHDLKSASGNIGAVAIYHLAAKLEQAARDHDHAGLDRLAEALATAVPVTLAQLASACGAAPPGGTGVEGVR